MGARIGTSGTHRPSALFLAVVLAFAAAPHASAQAAPVRAVLVRGTLSVRGVPHLPVNSIPALYGEYRAAAGLIRVWVVREELFLTPEWEEFTFKPAGGARIRAYSRPVGTAEGPGTAYALRDSSYWILAEVPAPAGDPVPFLDALTVRLAYFAAQARSPSDLSLPAVLELRSRE